MPTNCVHYFFFNRRQNNKTTKAQLCAHTFRTGADSQPVRSPSKFLSIVVQYFATSTGVPSINVPKFVKSSPGNCPRKGRETGQCSRTCRSVCISPQMHSLSSTGVLVHLPVSILSRCEPKRILVKAIRKCSGTFSL